jgi:segregation and condensation protein B
MKDISQLKRVLEGAMFAANEPMSIDKLLNLFEEGKAPDRKLAREALQALQQDYTDRGVELKDLASGWQFQVCQDLSGWVKRLWQERAPRYSRALMETLALVVYRQPITRAEIESVRGVAVSTQIVKTLEEHGWIREVGHKDVPGRPALLATTKQFLDHFGMKSLSELPPLAEIQDLDAVGEALQQQLQLDDSEVKTEEKMMDGDQPDPNAPNESEAEAEEEKTPEEEGGENEGLPQHPDEKKEDESETEDSAAVSE